MSLVTNVFIVGVETASNYRDRSGFLTVNVNGMDLNLSCFLFLWLAALTIYFIKTSLGIKAWAGPADAIYAAHQNREPLSLSRGFGSTIAAFVSASGGASVGQYGPLVHFGATVGIWARRFLTPKLSHEVYLGCGVAAGISAGFDAPLAGIIFAHEAVLRLFSIRAVAPISISAITASAINNQWFPSSSVFDISGAMPPLVEVLPILILITPLLSGVALAFMFSLRSAQRFAGAYSGNPALLLFMAATGCGFLGVFVPEILGLGNEAMNNMLGGQFSLMMLLVLLVAKLVASSLCIGFGLFGGIFGPAIFMGIAAGGLLAGLGETLGMPEFSQLAMVAAMAAVSASVIGAPITATVIVLELTRSYEFAIAAMMTVMLCNLLTQRVFSLSFFDRQLLDRGIDLRLGREAILLNQINVGEYVSDEGLRLESSWSGEKALSALKSAGCTEGYVCDENGILLGKASLFDALEAGSGELLAHIDKKPFVLYQNTPLGDAMVQVADFVGESIPVVDAATGELKGAVTEGDLFGAVISVQGEVVAMERGG